MTVLESVIAAAGDEPLTGWCPKCREKGVTFNDGRCVWCDTPTLPVDSTPAASPAPRPRPWLLEKRPNAKMSRRQVEAAHQLYRSGKSMGQIAELIWERFGYRNATTCASSLAHAFATAGFEVRERQLATALATRRVSEQLVDEAWARYQGGEQLPAVGQAFFDSGRTRNHTCWERTYECLIRQFRKRGYELRTRQENLAGRACRTEKRCVRPNNRGKPCGGNVVKLDDGTYGDYCWQHAPEYKANRDAVAHMERMRQRRRWVGRLVAMEPFVQFLERRKTELALPPEQRRWADRDESLQRLSRATGIDASTLIKWMRYRNSKGKPKHDITPEKVREVLEHDGTTTFEALYGEHDLAEAA